VVASATAWLSTVKEYQLDGLLSVKAGSTVRFRAEFVPAGERQSSNVLPAMRAARGHGVARVSSGISRSGAGKLGAAAKIAKRQQALDLELRTMRPLTATFESVQAPSVANARLVASSSRTPRSAAPVQLSTTPSIASFFQPAQPAAASTLSSDTDSDSASDYEEQLSQPQHAHPEVDATPAAQPSSTASKKRVRPSTATIDTRKLSQIGKRGKDKQPRKLRQATPSAAKVGTATSTVLEKDHCVFHCLVCGKQSLQKGSLRQHVVGPCAKFGAAYCRLVGMFANMQREAFVQTTIKAHILKAGVCSWCTRCSCPCA
jgi:hypothetical protein